MRHVVGTEQVAHLYLPPVAGVGDEGDGAVGLVGGGEEEVGGGDVGVLALELEIELLVLAFEDGDVGLAVKALEAFHHGLGDGAALGAQGELEFLVLQHDVAGSSCQCIVEEGGAVFACLGQFGHFLGFLGLFLRGGFLLLGLLLFYLLLLSFDVLLAGTVVPTESDQHHGDQNESDDGVFIHFCYCLVCF